MRFNERPKRLPGHELPDKGRGPDAVCACGERQHGLRTSRDRQAWHREHKERIGYFWGRVKKTDTCWIWQGSVHYGYGLYVRGDFRQAAHRYSYEEANGPIPEGLVIDHLCRNPSCVRPDHLEAVTDVVNILRGIGTGAKNAVKTRCKHGHPFDDANTCYRANGKRACRECMRQLSNDYKMRQRAKASGLAA